MRDLTAILVRKGEHDDASLGRAVAAGGYGDVWLRLVPLDAVGLLQLELFDGSGLPRIDPALVHALSQGGRRALFVHVNHEAKQAVVHVFHDGQQLDGWIGDPAELDAKLMVAVEHRLVEILDADDGTRSGIGVSASRTSALVRGRSLAVPPGLPTTLGSFVFHDGGADVGVGDRMALLALDDKALRAAWRNVPGAELAARVRMIPEAVLGPLKSARDPAMTSLAELGDRPPGAALLSSVPALELVALSETYLFGGGEPVLYVDSRFLPMFSLSSGMPVFDEDEYDEELEQSTSVLAAMVEVLPYASPEGVLMEQMDDDELRPLAPWARPGEEYVGSLLLLDPARLVKLLTSVDTRDMAARVDGFYRAWFRSQHEAGESEAFAAWRRALDEKGAPDMERFLRTWAEWRAVLAIAAVNDLTPALMFYGE